MRLKMFTVFDKQAKVFCRPFSSENNQTAIRAFAYSANDLTTDIGRYPQDFSLYSIGYFDDTDATWAPEEAELIVMAITLVDSTVEA